MTVTEGTRCAACGSVNLEGDDACANCGADLRTIDTPQTATAVEGGLLGEHLDDLGPAPAVTIAADTMVAAALQFMATEGTDCLLAMDDGRLVGIFTERDAVLKLAGRSLESVTLADVMTRDPVILRHDEAIAVAINKMAVGGFRHIPIVDGDRPTGVVGAREVFRRMLAASD